MLPFVSGGRFALVALAVLGATTIATADTRSASSEIAVWASAAARTAGLAPSRVRVEQLADHDRRESEHMTSEPFVLAQGCPRGYNFDWANGECLPADVYDPGPRYYGGYVRGACPPGYNFDPAGGRCLSARTFDPGYQYGRGCPPGYNWYQGACRSARQ